MSLGLHVAIGAAYAAEPVIFVPDLPSPGTPRIYYTDLLSGPSEGGEDNRGVYLSIFGKGFGTEGLGTTVKVRIGGAEVARYFTLGPSKGRPDIQQITVQIGSLGNAKPGVALPVEVDVGGALSNRDRSFTVNPGRILFVDNVRGDDSSAIPGDIAHPYRDVQRDDLAAGAYGEVNPGDVIVMRGTGRPWRETGFENYFLKFFDKSGSAPTGSRGSGPISVVAYPGEDVYVSMPGDGPYMGAISAVNGINYPGRGQWVTIAGLRIEGGGHDGAVNLQIHGDYWRVVNNELSAATARGSAKAGGIAGNGEGAAFLGNHIHDVAGDGQHNHGIYIDGDGSYEIAYNVIEKITGGNGLQMYANGSNGSETISNVSVHHNWIHDVAKHGINIADGSRDGISVFDNVVSGTDVAGIRFNTRTLHGCRVYNNTFYGTDRRHDPDVGAIMNDWHLPHDALDLRNNIFVPSGNTPYSGGTIGFSGAVGTVTNNLWFRGRENVAGGAVGPRRGDGGGDDSDGGAFGADAQFGDPRFVEPGVDFHLRAGSGAIGAGSPKVAALVTTDFDITNPTPQGAAFDLGAFARAP